MRAAFLPKAAKSQAAPKVKIPESRPSGMPAWATALLGLSEKTLTAKGRQHVKPENFAIPPDRYPIHDLAHARNALARVAQTGSPEEKHLVRQAVYRKYPQLKPAAEAAKPGYLAAAETLLAAGFAIKSPIVSETPASRKAESEHGKGKLWEVVVIEAGMSKNGREYPPETLKKAAAMFEDVNVFMHTFDKDLYDHLPDEVRSQYPQGVAGSMVGYLKNARYEEADGKGSIVADFHCVDSRLCDLFTNLLEENRLDKLGFSIDVEGTVSDGKPIHGVPTKRVESIDKVYALDVVTYPAAGGRVRRLKARETEAPTP